MEKDKNRWEKKWYFITKIVLTYCEKKIDLSDQEKLLKFEAEGNKECSKKTINFNFSSFFGDFCLKVFGKEVIAYPKAE